MLMKLPPRKSSQPPKADDAENAAEEKGYGNLPGNLGRIMDMLAGTR
jgi:hypothetical protein